MEISAERFAQLFHHYHEALSNSGKACCRTSDVWAEVPQSEKGRMIAAARMALLEVEVLPADGAFVDRQSSGRPADRQLKDRRSSERQPCGYFAKPGEAEWGC